MATFEVTMKDRTREAVVGADAYQQEGPMTTFFRTSGPRRPVDSWSVRVASFRTGEIIIVRRNEEGSDLGGADGVDDGREERPVTHLARRTA